MDRFLFAGGFKRRVLVVDDELINRELLGNMLGDHYEVVYAENGQEALGKLQGDESDISLILLDLLMPVMDGFELIAHVKEDEKFKHIPIIILTTEGKKEMVMKGLTLGANSFLQKPIKPDLMLQEVERLLNKAAKGA